MSVICECCGREFKNNLSLGMHRAHKQNKHPGWSKINTDKTRRSYPEKFMVEVFQQNTLYDKYTIIEKMPFSKYFLDFAFVEIKLCVEVDGSQHFRTQEAIEHDKERDNFLIEQGWKIYRINWLTFIKNKKTEINELVNFIKNIDNNTNRFYDIKEVQWKDNTPKYGTRQQYFDIIRSQFTESQQEVVNKLLNSDIDFSKFGWVNQASKIIGITPQKVHKWMKRIIPEFYEQCFKRK